MWDAGELRRLDRLRKLAVDTGRPAEVLGIIDGAHTADDALDALAAAGLMPTGEESAREVLSFFSPLLEHGCDQLDAEICAAEFIGTIRRASLSDDDVLPELLCGLIAEAAGSNLPEAEAMLRAMAAIGPDESRAMAVEVLACRGRRDWARRCRAAPSATPISTAISCR